jgi:hypothetical protein
MKFRHLCTLLSLIASLAVDAGCSQNAQQLTPGGVAALSSTRVTSAIANSASPAPSFASFVGQDLTSDQIEALIDPTVTGSDRKLAHYFMALMPKGMRGDFVYIRNDGTLLSNRPAALLGAHVGLGSAPSITPIASPGIIASGRLRNESGAPPPGTGGPYSRQYSANGVDAAYTYATFDCNDAELFNTISGENDTGTMYLGGFGNTGSGIDAGLQYNSSGTIQPFFNSSQLGGYVGLKYGNPQVHYTCGEPIGMMYGGLPYSQPDPTEPGNYYTFFAAGIPDIAPYDMQLPPAQSNWTMSAWTFIQTPSDFLNAGTDATGASSPCATCVTKRMLSIAQSYVTADSECLGACNGTTANRWDQTVMGQLVSPCANNSDGSSAECTIQYQSNNSWLGGYQVFPDSNVVQVNDANPNSGTEGINLTYDEQGTAGNGRLIPSAVTFKSGLPIAPATPCTPDSKEYCYTTLSQTLLGQCNTGSVGPRGEPIEVNTYKTSYYIFQFNTSEQTQRLLETATSAQKAGTSHCEPVTTTWSPQNPATQYGDSTLP